MKILDYEVQVGERFYDERKPFRELVSEKTSSGQRLRLEIAERGVKVELEGEAWMFMDMETLQRLMREVKGGYE